MSSTVFVLGAGASYGDTLIHKDDLPRISYVNPQDKPPLIHQFFNVNFLYSSPKNVEEDYKDLLDYIRQGWGIGTDSFGTGKWQSINLESVFTSLTIESEFSPPDTDQKAKFQILLNSLKKYIQQTIVHSTYSRYGKFTRQLVSNLKRQDSIINFNYDLLVDQELTRLMRQEHSKYIDAKDQGNYYINNYLQYENFGSKFFGKSFFEDALRKPDSLLNDTGLYLKMHGSLDWVLCTNDLCPHNQAVQLISEFPEQSLAAPKRGREWMCEYCKGSLVSYLIPPLLNKPIMRQSITRNIWSNAMSILAAASIIVVIGYSFPSTDFYAHWLFRSALRDKSTHVLIIDPMNSKELAEGSLEEKAIYKVHHINFKERMDSIFNNIWGYEDKYFTFDQIDEVLVDIDSMR